MKITSNTGRRELIFEKILMKRRKNQLYWEMLCSTERPLVPFIGAGLSAWRYPIWRDLLQNIGKEVYGEDGSTCIKEAMNQGISMDEIAECIFNRKDTTEFPYERANQINENLLKLWMYVGCGDKEQKILAQKKLYDKLFSKQNEKTTRPQYQDYIPLLFQELLVTTNYDKLLEELYDSILVYSYKDLNSDIPTNKDQLDASWLFKTVNEKLRKLNMEAQGKSYTEEVTLPNSPMLLKIHGNIERIDSAALTTEGYLAAYQGELPLLMKNIFRQSTVIFMGCSLADDYALENLKKLKSIQPDLMHFAFMCWEDLGPEKQRWKRLKQLKDDYGIYAITFSEKDWDFSEEETAENKYDFFYGLFLENLYSRKIYSSSSERISWSMQLKMDAWNESEVVEEIQKAIPEYFQKQGTFSDVRPDDVKKIREKIINKKEYPLICICGVQGSGKTTFCNNIFKEEFIKKNNIHLFNISLKYNSSWDDFVLRIYEEMNIVQRIPPVEKWEGVAKNITEISWSYWHTVILIEHTDYIEQADWDYVKKMLDYWKTHKVQVIFTCDSFSEEVPCYVWKAQKLENKELRKVFYDAYGTQQNTKDSNTNNEIYDKIFETNKYHTSSAIFLGKLAARAKNPKDFLKQCDEATQEICKNVENREEKFVSYLFCKQLKEELPNKDNRILFIKIWKILKEYPGNIPYCFFDAGIPDMQKEILDNILNIMKSCGICSETYDGQDKLLMNMNICIKKFFYDKILGNKNSDKNNEFPNIQWWKTWVSEKILDNKWNLDSLKKLEMPEYMGKFLEPTASGLDYGNVKDEDREPLFDLLKNIGKKVFNNAERNKSENHTLNLVLHQEIKSVIAFLNHKLQNIIKESNSTNEILGVMDVISDFSHYYHYISGYSYTFVKKVILKLNEMYKNENTREYKNKELYYLAILYNVQGDIQRILGKRGLSTESYHRVQELVNLYILNVVGEKSSEEIWNIGGEAMLATYYYKGTCEEKNNQLDAAKEILEKSGDNFAVAYCFQKKGETMFDELESIDNNKYIEIHNCYQNAINFFKKLNGSTEVPAISYIYKCMGDLESKRNSDENKLRVAYFYMESFSLYCKYINWQGMANVIQAMGTYCRTIKGNNYYAEKLYQMAKECFKMLGDTQGLADTLDYLGHNYSEKYMNNPDDLWLWKAINTWKESQYIWNDINVPEKERKSAGYVQTLLRKYKNDQWNEIITPNKIANTKEIIDKIVLRLINMAMKSE